MLARSCARVVLGYEAGAWAQHVLRLTEGKAKQMTKRLAWRRSGRHHLCWKYACSCSIRLVGSAVSVCHDDVPMTQSAQDLLLAAPP